MKLLVCVFIMLAMTHNSYAQNTSRAEENLKKLGITLPAPATPSQTTSPRCASETSSSSPVTVRARVHPRAKSARN